MALSLFFFKTKPFSSTILLQCYSEQILCQISCIVFVWTNISLVCGKTTSYRFRSWNLIFQHTVHHVFRNPSWCHTFHFDVNFSLLFFVLRLHFAINVLTVNPFVMCCCVYQIFVKTGFPTSWKESLSHAHTRMWGFLSRNQLGVNNEFVKRWGSHEVDFFFLSPKNERLRAHPTAGTLTC